jgi:hypothetical protein
MEIVDLVQNDKLALAHAHGTCTWHMGSKSAVLAPPPVADTFVAI